MIQAIIFSQKTVEEAIDKAMKHERTIEMLASELKHKEVTIEQLETQLSTMSVQDIPKMALGNDLDIFSRNEGGLHGIVRDFEDIVNVVEVSIWLQLEAVVGLSRSFTN